MPRALGILTSRILRYKSSIEYEVVPIKSDLSVTFETDLSSIADIDRTVIQSQGLPISFLSALHIIRFSYSTRFGFYIANKLETIKKIKIEDKIDESNVEQEAKKIIESLKDIDEAEFIRYEKIRLDQTFFVSVTSFFGGTTFAKKLYSLSVLTSYEENDRINTILMPLSMSFYYYHFNPVNLLGIIILKGSSYGFLLAKSLTKSDINNILYSLNQAVEMFYSSIDRANLKRLEQESEEE